MIIEKIDVIYKKRDKNGNDPLNMETTLGLKMITSGKSVGDYVVIPSMDGDPTAEELIDMVNQLYTACLKEAQRPWWWGRCRIAASASKWKKKKSKKNLEKLIKSASAERR